MIPSCQDGSPVSIREETERKRKTDRQTKTKREKEIFMYIQTEKKKVSFNYKKNSARTEFRFLSKQIFFFNMFYLVVPSSLLRGLGHVYRFPDHLGPET